MFWNKKINMPWSVHDLGEVLTGLYPPPPPQHWAGALLLTYLHVWLTKIMILKVVENCRKWFNYHLCSSKLEVVNSRKCLLSPSVKDNKQTNHAIYTSWGPWPVTVIFFLLHAPYYICNVLHEKLHSWEARFKMWICIIFSRTCYCIMTNKRWKIAGNVLEQHLLKYAMI